MYINVSSDELNGRLDVQTYTGQDMNTVSIV